MKKPKKEWFPKLWFYTAIVVAILSFFTVESRLFFRIGSFILFLFYFIDCGYMDIMNMLTEINKKIDKRILIEDRRKFI